MPDDNRLLQPSHENDNSEDGEGQLQGRSERRIYREDIRREVEVSPLRTKIETESEKATSKNADEFPASPLENKDE